MYSIADAMVSNGMHKLGFDHINLDDCWAAESRDADGNIRPDPTRFPSGMKAVADKLHGMGLKFGLYTAMGTKTCTALHTHWQTGDLGLGCGWAAIPNCSQAKVDIEDLVSYDVGFSQPARRCP